MADPNLDTSLYRMKVYAKLLQEDESKSELAGDLAVLLSWIEFARPLIGKASADQFSFSDIQRRHGPRSDE